MASWASSVSTREASAFLSVSEARAELASRSRAGSLQSQLDASRNKLKAAEEETKGVCRTAKNALALQAEVTRLEKLLSEAGVETSKRSTIMSLRMEIARLRKAAPGSEARPRKAPGRSRNPEETVASLREENARLNRYQSLAGSPWKGKTSIGPSITRPPNSYPPPTVVQTNPIARARNVRELKPTRVVIIFDICPS